MAVKRKKESKMAGSKKENQKRKSLTAENRFKKLSADSSRKKFLKNKREKHSPNSKPNFLLRVLRKFLRDEPDDGFLKRFSAVKELRF